MMFPNRIKILALAFTTGLSLGIPTIGQASDLSLPRHSKDVQLASFHAQPVNTLSQSQFIEEDPITEVLSVNEIDVWERIRQGFGIPDLENPLVDNQLNWYLKRPEYIQRTTVRASKYLFHIVQELEKRGMPTELALLPFIESAFNPHARSSAKAEGMWQFIPSTGLDYDLKQSVFKDDRRSVLSSTDAALTYLQRLYSMFGDWQLALAAYNWGEGSVQRAIKKNQQAKMPIDFNSLSIRMPAETRNYVPKLQAVKHIIANTAKYGIDLPEVENQPYFVTIGKTSDIDVSVAAKLSEMPVDEFRALNPQFGHHVITGSAKTQILLPKENAEKFRANLGQWRQPLSSWTAYQVTGKREKVEDIAEKYNTTADVIRHANHIPPNMVLKFGSTLLVPKASPSHDKDIAPELADFAKVAFERNAPETKTITVKVKQKDNVASIAKRYRVSVAQIKEWNELSSNSLPPGLNLKIQVAYKASVSQSKKEKVSKTSSTKTKLIPSGTQKSAKADKSEKVAHVSQMTKTTGKAANKENPKKTVSVRDQKRNKSRKKDA